MDRQTMTQMQVLVDVETRLRIILDKIFHISMPESVEDLERIGEESTRIERWVAGHANLDLLRAYCQVVQTLRMIQATEAMQEDLEEEYEDDGEEEESR